MTIRDQSADTEHLETALLRIGSPPPAQWYAVLDAAQNKSGPQRAARAGLRCQSLYQGRLGDMVADVAPHLVAFQFGNGFGRWFLDHWGENYGILLQTQASFEQLRKHLRRFQLVRDERGKRYRFRFYDPRVLRAFLPVCTAEERTAFFGPVDRFCCATRDGLDLLTFRRDA